MRKLKIIFFGTPEFAASQLEAILAADYKVAAVVTMPDKPAGRGRKVQISEVKKTALKHDLPVLQPENLKDPQFIKQLASFGANLFVVVAFRKLPREVWRMPRLGTFNLHASLLPQYRGAAPINHVIINGETRTGLTTFYINEEIDKGNVILRRGTRIEPDETAGELHDKLMLMGNKMIITSIRLIVEGKTVHLPQSDLLMKDEPLMTAPKITKEFCRINWHRKPISIYNLIRGLSPYPAAHTALISESGEQLEMKVFASRVESCVSKMKTGTVVTDNKTFLKVALRGGFLYLTEVQQAGKKRMSIADFLRGTPLAGHWKAET